MKNMDKISNIQLSVIIPVNKSAELQKTLESLAEHSPPVKYEIIIVNDGNYPDISRIITTFSGKRPVKEVTVQTSKGQFSARNTGVAYARGKWLLFLDGDICLPHDWFSKASVYFDSYDYITANLKLKKAADESDLGKLIRLSCFRFDEYFEKRRFGSTGFLFVRNNVFAESGGFDEQIFSGGDHVFGRKVFNSGNRQKFISDLTVYHEAKSNSKLIADLQKYADGFRMVKKLYPDDFRNMYNNTFRNALLLPLRILYKALMYKKNRLYRESELPCNRFLTAIINLEFITTWVKLKAYIKSIYLSSKKRPEIEKYNPGSIGSHTSV